MSRYIRLEKEGSGAEDEDFIEDSVVVREVDSSDDSHEVPLDYSFEWCKRRCRGTVLHEAVLKGDLFAASNILDEHPDYLQERFRYSTSFQGGSQEGSGEAIHLAASRGCVKMLQLLLERKSKIDSMVTRGGRDHYDVLHAAVFAEGKGGSKEIVAELLAKKAPMMRNLNGEFPLHKAFQTGRTELILLLREERERRGLPDLEVEREPKVPTPLELGIKHGRMSEDQLAAMAPHTPEALLVLSLHQPNCIPKWLAAAQANAQLGADELAGYVTVAELSNVLREGPVAGDALLRALTSTPEVSNEGLHPLPTRVNFMPRNWVQRVRFALNPPQRGIYLYNTETCWEYDSTTFDWPEWHNHFLIDKTKSKESKKDWQSIRDVDIKVCLVPNLACPEVFSAIADAADIGDEMSVFENPVVGGLISYVWWERACKIEMVNLLFSIWGLLLLIFEQYLVIRDPVVSNLIQARELRHSHGLSSQQDTSVLTWDDVHIELSDSSRCLIRISNTFIGARGIVDLLEELLVLAGHMCIDSTRAYISWSRARRLIFACLSISLLKGGDTPVVDVIVIFSYWFELFEVSNFTENLANMMLPITDLIFTLGPSFLFTLIAFLAFTHSFFKLKAGLIDGRAIFLQSFSVLFTGNLPTAEANLSELMLAYSSVVVFSLFFLNIFIGVISEQYASAKTRVRLRYQQVLCNLCLDYLLRCKILGTCAPLLAPRWLSFGLIAFACVAMLAVQIAGMVLEKSFACNGVVFSVCMLVAILAAFHADSSTWVNSNWRPQDRKKYYLWLIDTKPPSNNFEEELEDLYNQIADLRLKASMFVETSIKVPNRAAVADDAGTGSNMDVIGKTSDYTSMRSWKSYCSRTGQ